MRSSGPDARGLLEARRHDVNGSKAGGWVGVASI
jgi:hypothetical protein